MPNRFRALHLSALAVWAMAQPALMAESPAARTVRVGKHKVVNVGPWRPETRKENRAPELWQHYMHGVVDHFATPVPWEDLFGPEQDASKWLAADATLDTRFKTSTMPAVRIKGERGVALGRPLPLDMALVRGKRVRLFVWLRGEDVGARNNCWHAPSMWVSMRDEAGRVLSGRDSYFQTQRTFPWHCYYADRFVPRQAGGIYVRLFNKFHGRAYFSTLSWEVVAPANTYSVDERQDPFSGSLAFNTRYDEMPYHLKHGTLSARRYRWMFVKGAAIGLVGQRYDITTHAGFRKYYFEHAKKEPEHMNHAILYMQAMYRTGMKHRLLPPMEEGWLKNFARIIIDDQDPKTGFWHDGWDLSLGLTFHLCDMHFRYYGIPRPDRPDRVYGMDLGLRRIPRADRIIDTVLMMQSSYTDEAGVTRKAAWNSAAYRYTTTPDAYPQKCYLGTTWDAINLMRSAARYVDAEGQKKVYESVKAAWRYVLHKCVQDDGAWKQRDTDRHPTAGDYMQGLMRDVSWLERRVVPELPAPDVSLEPRGAGRYGLVWQPGPAVQNSVRIYVVDKGVGRAKVNESCLVGIIHRTGHRLHEMDPFLAVQEIRRVGRERWGWPAELPAPTHWRGKKYLPWKLRMIRYPLARADDARPIVLKIDNPAAKQVYVSAASWYGEESEPVAAHER